MNDAPSAQLVPLSRPHARALHREMLRIRRFEERCAELYSAGKIRGFLHLYIGEEAIAAGAMRALGPEDNVLATYREHGHAAATPSSPGTCRSRWGWRSPTPCAAGWRSPPVSSAKAPWPRGSSTNR